MAITTIRDTIAILSPSWLKRDVGGAILRAVGTVLDALLARTNEGVKLRMPGVATPTALGYIGNDRQIERGPNQPDAPYGQQLSAAFDTWRIAGSARAVLQQLRYYFTPNTVPAMSAVSNSAVWHVLNVSNGSVTKHVDSNWNWDGTTKWWRGWIIMDGTVYWILDYWNLGGTWGDGGVWGSNMTESDAESLKRIIKKWEAEHNVGQLIIVFDTSLFKESNVLAANVNGTGEQPSWRAPLLANFCEPQVNT